jgi:hypothetical protein
VEGFWYVPRHVAPDDWREPGVRDLIDYLVSRIEETTVVYPLVVAGSQGVGKSRLLAALAVELRRAGLRVYYDIFLPSSLDGAPWDYMILDDLAAVATAWKWQTRAGRLLRKIEILARELSRRGYAIAAPRFSDVLKFFRERAHLLVLYDKAELRQDYGVTTDCDVLAVYAKPISQVELLAYYVMGVTPRTRRYCIKWSEFRWYGDREWQREYERVQAKRRELAGVLLREITAATSSDAVREALREAVEELHAEEGCGPFAIEKVFRRLKRRLVQAGIDPAPYMNTRALRPHLEELGAEVYLDSSNNMRVRLC